MTFQYFLRSLRKRWLLVLICAVGMGLLAYGGSTLLLHPLYASTVTIQVVVWEGGSPFTKGSIQASQSLATTEADLATTSQVLGEVAAHYPGLLAHDLRGTVTAAARSNTPLFSITVQDRNPSQAATLANDIARTLIKQQLQMMQRPLTEGGFLVIAEQARPAVAPVSPNKPLSSAAGLFLGLVIGALLVMLFAALDPRVQTQDELAQLLEWPLLATIWRTPPKEAFRANMYSRNANAYNLFHTYISSPVMEERPLRTLVVTSSTPNEGKTVIAANLAMHMALAGKKNAPHRYEPASPRSP